MSFKRKFICRCGNCNEEIIVHATSNLRAYQELINNKWSVKYSQILNENFMYCPKHINVECPK